MQNIHSLVNHFLIAMPAMDDPCFGKTLIYIAEHNSNGALGLIVNRPTDLDLATLLDRASIAVTPARMAALSGWPTLFGGPVQPDRGFVLHRPLGQWQSTLAVTNEIGLTSSRDILSSIVQEKNPPQNFLVALGYAGWGAGQLEHELARNSWLTAPANTHTLFELPYEEKLASAMDSLGVDPTRLSHIAGHA